MTRRSAHGRYTEMPPALLRERAALAAAQAREEWEQEAGSAAHRAVGSLPSPLSLLRPDSRALALSRAIQAVAAIPNPGRSGVLGDAYSALVIATASDILDGEVREVEALTKTLRAEWSIPRGVLDFIPDEAPAA